MAAERNWGLTPLLLLASSEGGASTFCVSDGDEGSVDKVRIVTFNLRMVTVAANVWLGGRIAIIFGEHVSREDSSLHKYFPGKIWSPTVIQAC